MIETKFCQRCQRPHPIEAFTHRIRNGKRIPLCPSAIAAAKATPEERAQFGSEISRQNQAARQLAKQAYERNSVFRRPG